jgi:hypothetical protein
MNPTFRRAAIIAASLGLLLSLFLALRSDGDEPGATTTQAITTAPTTTEAATTTEAVTTEAVTTEAEPPAPVLTVRVEGGKPVGGVQRLTAKQGERVTLIVRSDTADEVHVHGYDLASNVGPGAPAKLTFAAKLVGRFEVELHHSGEQIAELTVEP